MDSMRGKMFRAQGGGSSSRGIREGASDGSGPSGPLGDPPHVEGRARVSTGKRGSASDGGGDGAEFSFPLLLRRPQGVESECPPECRGLLGGGNKQSRRKKRGRMTVWLGGLCPWVYAVHPHKSVGLGLRKGP